MCCAFLQIEGIKITALDLFSNESNKQYYTLGQMLKGMKKSLGFKQSFKEQLSNFANMRNTFIHNYWVINHVYALDQPIDKDTFERISNYQNDLQKETIYMTQVFLGLHYSIGAVLASRQGQADEFESDPEYQKMKEHAPVFLSVIESE